MKTKQLFISSTLFALLSFGLMGCGSSDSTDAPVAVEPTGDVEAITAMCGIPDDILAYQVLNSGDTIVDETGQAELSLFQVSDGSKKVCISSGTASIVRS